MRVISSFFRALAKLHTYNLLANPEAWFGLLWGLPIPLFSFMLDGFLLGWEDRTFATMVAQHPWQLAFLAHPFLFAIVFGAMGTILRDLGIRNRELIARLEIEATTDPLTGVHNRRFVLEELDKAAARAQRSTERVAVVMFDMDNFKAVNDTQGHLAGDKLLKDVAAALNESLRRGDTLGRFGGDEFLLVAPGTREGAMAVTERARACVLERTTHTISAGVALSGEDGKAPAELIAAADRQLAVQKKDRKTKRLTIERT